jgi:regulator of sigma E protease
MNILTSLHNIYETIIPIVILLGLLIFVHEMGHFLVAKYFNVRVEVFSLGFGPKLFKRKWGDTEYALSIIPLGGYVKMFGDDPSAQIDSVDRKFSFLHKPVGQRIAVVLAGPLMNLLFAFIVFMMMVGAGESSVVAKLGDIVQNSPAFVSGFRSGDTLLGINGQPVRYWDQVSSQIEESGSQKMVFSLERESGEKTQIEVTPTLGPSKNIMSWKKQAGEIEGISISSKAAAVAVIPGSAADKAGFKTGDVITKIGDKKILALRQLGPSLERAVESLTTDQIDLEIEIERGALATEPPATAATTESTKNIKLSFTNPALKNGIKTPVLDQVGFADSQLVLAFVQPDSPAQKGGLKPLDKIVSVNGVAPKRFEDVVSSIQSFAGTTAIQFDIERGGEKLTLPIQPSIKERMSNQGREEKRFEVGIRPLIVDNPPEFESRSLASPIDIISRGWHHTANWTSITVLGLVRLFDGSVSSKNVGGLLSIGSMAKKSWQAGFQEFLRMMGIISINLFVLNLLPVPVLDGGHLVFYTLEVLRGAPLPTKKQEALQQVGVIMLFSLMIFALYNDVARLFFRS